MTIPLGQAAVLLDLLEQSARTHPGATAVLGAEGSLTYAQLQGQSMALGAALAAMTKKSVVALFIPMCTPFPSAFFGGLYAGKAVLPLNMLLPGEELAYILADSGADLILTLDLFKPKLEQLPAQIVTLEELKARAASAPMPSAEALTRALAPLRPKPADLATLLYTSGTTGKPKGVELTHGNLVWNTSAAIKLMEFTPEYRVLACLPTFHTLAITATMLAPLAAGGSLFTLPRFNPDAVLQAAAQQACNVLMMVPSMYRLVTRAQEKQQLPLGHLKLAVAGGEPLPEEIRNRFESVFGIPLMEGYGLTETSPVIAFNVPSANRPGTVGKPLAGLDVKIVDPETQQPSPKEGTGEIWVKGPSVMRGYRNKPEETAQVLHSDGWLRTGDMGHLDADGYLKITGRLKEMIKVAGEMVFPAEVENVLLKHPAVQETGVVGEPDPRRGESVKAFVTLNPGQQASADELLVHCRAALAPYKVPRSIEFRAELPKGPTGKVLRRMLK